MVFPDRDRTIPEWTLERYLLGELPAEEMARIREEMRQNAVLRERLAALEASNRDIQERYPAGWMVSRIREKTGMPERRRRPSVRTWALIAVPALAALLLVMVLPRGSDIRLKGGRPHLMVYRKTAEGIERLEDQSTVRMYDLVQVAYRGAGRKYGVILSVDGRGAVTLHLPENGMTAVRLAEGRADTLDFAYELDDAPRWERFYFVTSDTPFGVAPVMAAARRLAAPGGDGDSLMAPEALDQVILTLKKGE